MLPAYGHFLIVGASYLAPPAPNGALTTGITDAASIRLIDAGAIIDAVCYQYDATTLQELEGGGYTCKGTPVSNLPHDDSASAMSDVDASIERKPGGALGSCTDTEDNAADFKSQSPSTPQNASSPPTP